MMLTLGMILTREHAFARAVARLAVLVVTLAAGSGPGQAAAQSLPETGGRVVAQAEEKGDGRRELQKTITIEAPVEEVWAVWTDPEAMTFLSAESNIEIRVGGPYEWFLDLEPDEFGRRGGEGSRVLAFLPYRVLAFDWTFPPSIPSLRGRQAKTQVVVRFEEDEGGTRILFSQIGWQEGEDWDAGYDYFDQAWDYVLQTMKEHLEGGSSPLP